MKWHDLLPKADVEQKRTRLMWAIIFCNALFLILSILAFVVSLYGHYKTAYYLAIDAVAIRVSEDIFEKMISKLHTFEIHNEREQKVIWIRWTILVCGL